MLPAPRAPPLQVKPMSVRPALHLSTAHSSATKTTSATVTQQLHSWPVSRALASSAAGDSQNDVSGDQLEQFGAAGYAVHCTRCNEMGRGVVLCTRVAWRWPSDGCAGRLCCGAQ